MYALRNIENLFKTAEEVASSLGYKLYYDIKESDLIDKEENLYTDSMWFGGPIFSLKNEEKNILIELNACGDINASLIRLEDDAIIESVKDTRNSGAFYSEMSYYIKGDTELYAMENGEHPTYELVLENNNWFECFVSKLNDYNDYYSDVVDGNLIDILEDIESLINFAEDC